MSSFPARPRIVSAPGGPASTSFPGVPVIVGPGCAQAGVAAASSAAAPRTVQRFMLSPPAPRPAPSRGWLGSGDGGTRPPTRGVAGRTVLPRTAVSNYTRDGSYATDILNRAGRAGTRSYDGRSAGPDRRLRPCPQ